MNRPDPVPAAFESDGPDPAGWRLAMTLCHLLMAAALIAFAAVVAVETRVFHAIF